MKTTSKIKQLTLACLLAVTSMMINSVGAAESDFQTKEYFASNGLDLINAASAYTQGFTGEGVLIGLLDTPMREDHPELSGKFEVVGALDEVGNSVPNPTTWTQDVSHGTHVASIMAAKKDGVGMHGVAFDSSVVGQVYIGSQSYYFANEEKFFQAHPEIKILNNSWNGMVVDKSFVP
ncbi:S8 family serine peptidase, partial [Parasutterella excrementihominis]